MVSDSRGLSRKRSQRLLERVLVLHVQRHFRSVDLSQQSNENFARTNFYKRLYSQPDEHLGRTCPLHRSCDLTNKRLARFFRVLDRLGVDIGDDGKAWWREPKRTQVEGQAVLSGLHERAVEGGAHGQHHGAFSALCFRQFRSAFHRRLAAGDDDLIRRVYVGRCDRSHGFDLRLPAHFLERLQRECQYCRHRPHSDWYRFLHVFAAFGDGSYRVAKAQGSRRYMRGVFAEAMPRNILWLHAFFRKHTLSSDGNRKNRGLSDLGELQLVFRTFKTKLGKRITKRAIGFRKRLACHAISLGKLLAHSD